VGQKGGQEGTGRKKEENALEEAIRARKKGGKKGEIQLYHLLRGGGLLSQPEERGLKGDNLLSRVHGGREGKEKKKGWARGIKK